MTTRGAVRGLALWGRGARLTALASAMLLLASARAGTPPIVEAAKARAWTDVRSLLEAGADADAAAADGTTALHWASYWDHVETVRLLIRSGADVDAANDLGATPLWIASENSSAPLVRVLLDAGADPDARLLSGESPVMTAARTGDPEVLELLLAAGADPNARGTRGQSALMWAAAQQHPDAVRVLLAHGADVHARSDEWSQLMAVPPHADAANQQEVPHGSNTALMFAVRVGDAVSARLLLEAGADMDDADAWGVSATVLAAHSGLGELVELLLEAGADANHAGAGFSALHLAVMRRDEALARTLLVHGADPNARIANWTPTRRASEDWHIHPALVGATPFWLAARLAQPAMMRLLLEHGADPLFVHRVRYVGAAGSFGAETRDEATTTLMAAVGMGGPRGLGGFVDPDPREVEALRLEAVKLTVQMGVDVEAADLAGRTAADAATGPAVTDFLAGVSSGL